MRASPTGIRMRSHGIDCSMSRPGECHDDAVAKSFFDTVKIELIHRQTWRRARRPSLPFTTRRAEGHDWSTGRFSDFT